MPFNKSRIQRVLGVRSSCYCWLSNIVSIKIHIISNKAYRKNKWILKHIFYLRGVKYTQHIRYIEYKFNRMENNGTYCIFLVLNILHSSLQHSFFNTSCSKGHGKSSPDNFWNQNKSTEYHGPNTKMPYSAITGLGSVFSII